jgi:hypothetical protein
MVKFVEHVRPKVKFRFEVLFKKFHPRINLTTLFYPKPHLLNTIKPFPGHENRSLAKLQNPLQEVTLRNMNFKKFNIQDIKLAPKTPGAKISAF